MRRTFLPDISMKTLLLGLTMLLFLNRGNAQCTVSTFPYTDLTSTPLPSCWTASAAPGYYYLWDATTSDGTNGVSGPQTGTGFAFLDVYNADQPWNTYNLTSPPIALPAGAMQLSYYYFLGADGFTGTTGSTGFDPYPLSVYISTNAGATWTDIYDHSSSNSVFGTSNSTSGWAQNVISLIPYTGQTIQIMFVSNSNYGVGTCNQGLNAFSVSQPPPCLGTASGLTLGSQTGSNTVIHWTDASPTPSNGYNWIVVPSGAGSSATPVASGTNLVGDDSSLVTGLSPLISYDYYIQTFCGGASLGTWIGPFSFSQPCGNISAFPYTALSSSSLDACWNTTAGSGAYINWATTTSDGVNGVAGPHSGTYFTYLDVYDAEDFYNTYNLVSPPFALPAATQALSYYYYLGADGYTGTDPTGVDPYPLIVQISTDGGVTWADLYDHSTSNSTFATSNSVTNWTQNIINLGAYANQTVLIQFVANSNFGLGYCDIGLDQFMINIPPACAGSPANISLASATSATADIHWTDATPNPAVGYNWILVASGAGTSGTPVASGTGLVGDDSTFITGLSPQTSYDYYIQSNCGGAAGAGAWAGPLTFTTPCAATALPLAEGFNNIVIPNCWTQQYVTGTNDIRYVPSFTNPATTPQEGSDYAFWNSYSIFNGETRLVSPPLTSVGVPSVDVSFYWFNEHSNNYDYGNYLNEGVKVQYSLDGTTWTDVQFYSREDASFARGTGAWKQKYLTLPTAVANQAQFYVGFSFVAEDGDNCSFDHLNIFPSLPCAGGATAIHASSTNANGATIQWTDGATVPSNGYNWVIVNAGDSATSPTPVLTGSTAAGADSIVVTGLTPSTSYDVYVQSNCGGTGLGYWAGAGSFHTPCAAITSIPWTEGFESLGTNVGQDILPPCWVGTPSRRWTSSDAPITFPITIPPHAGSNFVYGRNGAKDTLFTPGFALTGGTTYEFYYYYMTDGNQGWDSIKTMYGTSQDAANMTTLIGSQIYSPTNTSYVKYVATFTPATSGTYYFGVNLNAGFNPDYIGFDDFGLELAPQCSSQVSDFGSSHVTPTTANLNWSAGVPTPAAGYNWELVAPNAPSFSTALFSGSTAPGVDSVVATGLTPATSYDLYAQGNCGGALGAGDWDGPYRFTTPCTAITSLPWHDGFESLAANTGQDILPPCWLPTPHRRWGTSNTPFTFPTLNPRSGTNFLYDRYNANDTVFTPGFSLTGGQQYEFYFYYATDGYNGWDSIYAMYGNYQDQSSMTTVIGTPVISPVNTNYIKYSAIFTPATSGTYYFGVKLAADFNPDDIAFDDFGLQEVVPCPNPPLGGTIAGPGSVCPGATVTLSLTGYSPYTVLQWQTSSDSINFSDIGGASSDYITTNITSVSYFRVKVLCADSSYSAIFPVYINSPIVCYCTNNLGGGCGGSNIDTAEIVGTNFFVNYTTCNNVTGVGAYTRFPQLGDSTTTLQRGSSYPIYLHFTGFSISSVWIDYDHSGTFDSIEWVQPSTAAGSGTAILQVPANAMLGVTGMRIRSRNEFNQNGAFDPCTHFGSGETFDFLLTIVDTNCNHAPTVIDTVTNVSCFGLTNGAIALGISGNNGPYTSLWSTGATTSSISGLSIGAYTDTINFDFGCSYVWHDTVTQPTALSGVTDSITNNKCFGNLNGAIYVSASGGTPGYSSHWSSGDATPAITAKAAGVYTDTITDAHGCRVVVGPDTIRQPATAVAVVTDSIHNEKCNGQSIGAAYITASGGTAPYHYSWSNTTSGRNLLNVPVGRYVVVVTDTNGCTATTSDSISQPTVLNIVTDSVKEAKCHTSSDGSIYVHVTGGTPNYTYTWTGGSHSFNLFLKPAGIYTLTITDANNCSATATDTITGPAALTLASTITNQIQNGALGSITTTVGGGTQPYTHHWSNGSTSANLTNLSANVYIDTVTDANGCRVVEKDTVILIPTGINEIGGDVKDFSVYPNPSTGLYNILVDLNRSVPVDLEVFSMTGQQISVIVKQGAQGNLYNMDLSDQPSGVYMIKLTAGDNTVVRRITLVK